MITVAVAVVILEVLFLMFLVQGMKQFPEKLIGKVEEKVVSHDYLHELLETRGERKRREKEKGEKISQWMESVYSI